MLKWKNEIGANGACHWLNLSNNIEVSLFKRYGNKAPYLYNFTWGSNCHWTEHIIAENWEKAKEKAIKKTIKIITNYLTDLKYALEALNEIVD